ncbi:hypothetical protein, partial [Achromobacter mucicolens]|uniref:hypothetical protein n=1 Tax=Achromobacter mucicolens TaxID=1389922 RepID=UPI0028A8D505
MRVGNGGEAAALNVFNRLFGLLAALLEVDAPHVMDDGGLLCLSFLSYLDAAQPHKLSSPNAVDVGAAQDPTRWHSVKRMPLEANGGSAPGFHCFGKALTHVAPSESYFCHHDKEPGMIVLITLR